MRLLIVSHTAHHVRDGEIVGWGATIREIDHLAGVFSHVTHIATMHDGPAPDSAIPYAARNVELKPVRPSGGGGLRAKLGILGVAPAFVRLFLREVRTADVIHVRCPSNISMMAVVLLAFIRPTGPRWAKYAGNWSPDGREPWSYTFQRWWLRTRKHRGVVTVNGRWPGQQPYIHSFVNPCLTDDEVNEGRAAAAGKDIAAPVRLVFVGRVEEEKGVGRAIQVVEHLRSRGIAATFDIVGDGPERASFEEQAARANLMDRVVFHGWIPRPELPAIYARAHIMLFPSRASEGWPKVLTEAMAYGVVPVCGSVSSIPQYLEQFGVGRACPPADTAGMADAIASYIDDPIMWKTQARAGMQAAESFSYTNYLRAVRRAVLGEKA